MSLSDKVLSGLSARRGTLSKSKQAELDAFLKEQRTWRKKLDSYKKNIRDTLEELIAELGNPDRG